MLLDRSGTVNLGNAGEGVTTRVLDCRGTSLSPPTGKVGTKPTGKLMAGDVFLKRIVSLDTMPGEEVATVNSKLSFFFHS